MKKRVLASVFLLANGVAAISACAADGTITLTGEITGTTCSIGGGTGAAPSTHPDFSVPLSKVQASALKAPGQTAGAKPFFIHVGACPQDTVVAVLYESSSPAINPATGNLRNLAPAKPKPADHVEVQIVDGATNQPMDLRLGANSTSAKIPASGEATLPFTAQYFATGAATAGPVSTQVLYSATFL